MKHVLLGAMLGIVILAIWLGFCAIGGLFWSHYGKPSRLGAVSTPSTNEALKVTQCLFLNPDDAERLEHHCWRIVLNTNGQYEVQTKPAPRNPATNKLKTGDTYMAATNVFADEVIWMNDRKPEATSEGLCRALQSLVNWTEKGGGFLFEFAETNSVELGLRADGVVVWRREKSN